ncbi:MAG: DNA/RNA non-specific endonuclease [Phycisphaerae bacterium]
MAGKSSSARLGIFLLIVVLLVLAGIYFWPVQNRANTSVTTTAPGNLSTPVANWDNDGVDETYAGIPKSKPEAKIKVLVNHGFMVGYDENLHDPVWTAYRLDHSRPHTAVPRPHTKFTTDERTQSLVTHDDYTGSGYDRGHLAPSRIIGALFGPEAQLETFRMSNITPQKANLNQKVWQRLETLEYERYLAQYDSVWVITGPIFTQSPPPRLASGVAIPQAFYRVFLRLDHGLPVAQTYIIPQTVQGNEAIEGFLRTVQDAQTQTALDFFYALPDDIEQPMEAKPSHPW